MPNRSRKPRRSRRPMPAPRQRGYLDTAAQALTVAYAVRKLINVEYHRVAVSFTADPNTSGAVVNLTAIAQGDDTNDRQGNKIRLKQLLVQGKITLNSTTATDSHVRMVIVRDNNGSTTQPSIAELYGSVANFTNNLLKVGDPQTNSRFSVLWDKFIIVDTDKPSKAVAYSQSLDSHCFFSGTGATDEGKGAIYLFISSNEATNDPVVNILGQVVYIDN